MPDTPSEASISLARLQDTLAADNDIPQNHAANPAAFGLYAYDVSPAEHHWPWLDTVLTNKRSLIVAPRESAKTTWMAEIMLSWWIGAFPLQTNYIASVTDTLAQERFNAIQTLIESSSAWQDIFPHIVPDTKRGWSGRGLHVKDTRYAYKDWLDLVQKQGHVRVPTLSTGGIGSATAIGKRLTGLTVVDDPHNESNSRTANQREQVWSWLMRTLMPAVTEHGHACIITTRWNRDDVAGRLMHEEEVRQQAEEPPIWHIHEVPAIDNAGRSYWPAVWPVKRLEDKRREIGSSYFNAMYLNKPEGLAGEIFDPGNIQYFPYPLPDFRRVGVFVDLALSTSETADYTAIVTVAVDEENNYYILDMQRGRWSPDERDRKILRAGIFAKRRFGSLNMIGVEANQFQSEVIRQLRRKASLPWKPISPKKDKVSRAREYLEPAVEVGQVYADRYAPWWSDFADELADFPHGAHDDQVDVVVYGFNYLISRNKVTKRA